MKEKYNFNLLKISAIWLSENVSGERRQLSCGLAHRISSAGSKCGVSANGGGWSAENTAAAS